MINSLEDKARKFAAEAHGNINHGNRKVRKGIDREHTAIASPEAKTIKLADLIDKSKNIIAHDPTFARVYLAEKEMLLEVLVEGDQTLWNQANDILKAAKG